MMSDFSLLMAVLTLGWFSGNLAGWFVVGRTHGSFNWRIWLGPWKYGNWLDAQ
jgi:hypothetical protein